MAAWAKKVTAYIRENKLQVETNKRQFVPDDKLQSILGPLDAIKKGKDGKTDAEKEAEKKYRLYEI